ncbi:hypothetical protein ACFUEM_08855 [Streptomyces anulatus]|uniref:hypothetical protein n=1 Tax=Streptomyces anulatus TaxID=1892 RepID=UPI0035E11800
MHYAVRSREADISVNASPGDYDGVRVDVDDNAGTGTAFISGEYTPAQARELAAALLRAADEAEDVEPLDEGNARATLENVLVSGHIVADSTGSLDFGDVDRYRDAVAERVRSDTAAFIRSNIDLQGLDFPDAESVAVWLKEGR